MIKDFCYRESDYQIFVSELADRLPDHILDGHVHCWSRDCLCISPKEYQIHRQYKPWTDFENTEEFTLEDFSFCAQTLFPGKDFQGIFFGLPFPQADRIRCNEYIQKAAAAQGAKFYYIPGQFEDAQETERKYGLLSQPGFLGWKPYPDLAVSKEGREICIHDMLPQSFLEMADSNRLCIMLHLPGRDRLRSAPIREELEAMICRYPNARFIIAHAGRAFCYYDIEGTIDFLTKYENVWFDTALLNDPMVLEYLMTYSDKERILFGSDAPLAFTRGKDICVNNRHYYVSEKTVPWGLGPGKEGFLDATYYLYEEMRAFLYAAGKVYASEKRRALEFMLHDNMYRMISYP